ncbi:MAG: HPF/RaiA family ribosome-associated protein [Ectothiorhodospiraceae bacterium]|nr:HPF/RaiA family ribosome-associated protein [Ectothiorhodospiraceae bacterium]
MQLPLEITFRGMDASPAIEARVRKEAARLDRFSDQIMRCHVVVEAGHRRHHKGNLYGVKIDVTVPGTELVVTRNPDAHQAHQDAHVSVHDAFDAMRRQLEDYARKRRGDVKHHESPPLGRVKALFPERDYGLIESDDGREIYFHRNSVVQTRYEDLAVGTTVQWVEEAGENGPQASTVRRA